TPHLLLVSLPRRRSSVHPTHLSINDAAPTDIYTLSLHDALPILGGKTVDHDPVEPILDEPPCHHPRGHHTAPRDERIEKGRHSRSEEHTSELQSRENLVCRLLLEKKKKKQ